MHWEGLHAIRWSLNSKVGVDPLSGSIGLRSAMEKVLEDVRCALDIALDTLDALNTVGALDAIVALGLESATGGSFRDHWIRGCFRSRSFSSVRGCILIYNFTHFFRSSLEGTKGNRRASVLGFGVVEGDGITLV